MINFYKTAAVVITLFISTAAVAQVEDAGGVRRRSGNDSKTTETSVKVSDRMQDVYTTQQPHEADLAYMRRIYRQLDLTKAANTPLYYPEDIIDGQENLFRIILRLVVDGKIPAYEYLDGREVFTDQYKVNVGDMLDRFGIYAQKAKGSTEKNPKFVIEEADVPTGQVLNYYILEKWEFDRRSNQMKTRVEAICPVLNRYSDIGDGEAKYPMFWVKYDALRPYLAQQYVFLTDDNNLPQYTLDDFFTLGKYDGEIYKTHNLRNLSMNQMFPDEDDLKRAQDSIDQRLRTFGKDLWVPSREEYLAMKEKQAKNGEVEEDEVLPERTEVSGSSAKQARASKKRTSTKKTKKPKVDKSSDSGSNSNAVKSVRRRRR